MALTTTVMWIRHAPTHTAALIGWTDIEADVSDSSAIAWLQQRIPDEAIVVASDLRRASVTADAITGSRRRLPDAPGLRELNFGEWEGRTADEISQSHPEESRKFWSDPTNSGPPGGESWKELTERAGQFLQMTMTRFPGQTIVAVSHFGTILSQAIRASNAERFQPFSRPVRNWSLTRMSYFGGASELLEFSALP